MPPLSQSFDLHIRLWLDKNGSHNQPPIWNFRVFDGCPDLWVQENFVGIRVLTPGKRGGLNRSTQHLLRVYPAESENPKFVVGVDLRSATLFRSD
jgi:hypothetical protein